MLADAILLEVGVIAALVKFMDGFIFFEGLANGLVEKIGLNGQFKLGLV